MSAELPDSLLNLIDVLARYAARKAWADQQKARREDRMTEAELMLWGANHELDDDCRSLLAAAVEQVGLLEQAALTFSEVRPMASATTALHADTATTSSIGMPAAHEAEVMAAIAARDTGRVLALFDRNRANGRKLMLLARSFVYELALFRGLLQQLSSPLTGFAQGKVALLGKLEVIAPDVVNLRDTLAHYDERAVGRARSKAVQTTPTTAGGETLNRGLRLDGVVLGGHTAQGDFAEVEISILTVEACRKILRDAYALFPAKPGLEQAMANWKQATAAV